MERNVFEDNWHTLIYCNSTWVTFTPFELMLKEFAELNPSVTKLLNRC